MYLPTMGVEALVPLKPLYSFLNQTAIFEPTTAIRSATRRRQHWIESLALTSRNIRYTTSISVVSSFISFVLAIMIVRHTTSVVRNIEVLLNCGLLIPRTLIEVRKASTAVDTRPTPVSCSFLVGDSIVFINLSSADCSYPSDRYMLGESALTW